MPKRQNNRFNSYNSICLPEQDLTLSATDKDQLRLEFAAKGQTRRDLVKFGDFRKCTYNFPEHRCPVDEGYSPLLPNAICLSKPVYGSCGVGSGDSGSPLSTVVEDRSYLVRMDIRVSVRCDTGSNSKVFII